MGPTPQVFQGWGVWSWGAPGAIKLMVGTPTGRRVGCGSEQDAEKEAKKCQLGQKCSKADEAQQPREGGCQMVPSSAQ